MVGVDSGWFLRGSEVGRGLRGFSADRSVGP